MRKVTLASRAIQHCVRVYGRESVISANFFWADTILDHRASDNSLVGIRTNGIFLRVVFAFVTVLADFSRIRLSALCSSASHRNRNIRLATTTLNHDAEDSLHRWCVFLCDTLLASFPIYVIAGTVTGLHRPAIFRTNFSAFEP